MEHPRALPSLLYADSKGNITELADLGTCAMDNGQMSRPSLEDFIPMPPGSELFQLPGRLPVGWDQKANEPALVTEDPYSGDSVQAVAAFIAPAHTLIHTAAYQTQPEAPTLPLFAYCCVGWFDDRFWVAAFRSDHDIRQDFTQYRQQVVQQKTKNRLKKATANRLIQHLGKCCLTYGCPAARNYFLGRWEAPLPTSPVCNADCIGCISLQTSGCCPSTQDRIAFVPTAKEIADMAVPHLRKAANPIVSFGQGCEGEPLLQAATIERAITLIRSQTPRGTINLNSNASLPRQVEKLAAAGLDSMRVSLNSSQEHYYTSYYRPKNYRFSDVMESIDVMKHAGRFVSLNLFILPGFTDTEPEYQALCHLLERHRPDFIQLRNLNMDPEWYLRSLGFPQKQKAMGIPLWRQRLGSDFPELGFGYFNPQINPLS